MNSIDFDAFQGGYLEKLVGPSNGGIVESRGSGLFANVGFREPRGRASGTNGRTGLGAMDCGGTFL